MRKPSLSLPLFQTRMVMLWERLYAGLVPILIVFFVFIGLALFGVFDGLPGWLHVLALVNFLGLLVWAIIVAEPHLMFPKREETRSRLERESGLPPGQLADLDDRPFAGSADNPLWQMHRWQMIDGLGQLRAGKPRAVIDRTDPYALRIPALLLALLGLLVAGPAAQERISSAIKPSFGDRTPVTADIWIEPPEYTRQPPRFLVRGEAMPEGVAEALTLPAGSILRVRANRAAESSPDIDVTLPHLPSEEETPDGTRTPGTFTATLQESGIVTIRIGRDRMDIPVELVPDTPPTVRLVGEPSVEGGIRTRLTISVEDDYGITDGATELRLAANLRRPPDAPPIPGPLGPARIDAPALRGEPGTRDVAIDLTEHPWAGLPVSLRIIVTDGAGQTATSQPVTLVLPERTFYNPLSRAIIEQRQNLALAPQSWRRTLSLLDALTVAPEMFAADAKEYLLLRTAFHDVEKSRGENVDELVESFWPLAIALEDEGLTLARQRLEAAQEALRQALANGASPEEIDELVEELRQAMADYLAALAASGDALAQEEGVSETVEGQDLNDILDEIARLRRQGDSEAARARLAELEQMLQNMRITQGNGEGESTAGGPNSQSGENGDGEPGEGQGGTLGEAGELIDQQRRLADETFSARRGDRTQSGLAQGQRDLAEAARNLSDEAAGEQSAGAQALDQAAQMMEGAARALERGDLTSAGQAQERAMSLLRDGAAALAEEAIAAEDAQDGDGRAADSGSVAGQSADRDPLGRLYQGMGDSGVEIPDLSDPERVRELTRSLRERLRDPALPEADREYIERLLRRF
ncbi:DUF4175 domain-containing protein [Parvularcula marina]|uniref:DUF4175 domain-containing protein n=1 Tax=Parvularcula marina TaxID=2292771 RepID=UPI003514B9AD